MYKIVLLVLFTLALPFSGKAETLRVAVASNFAGPAEALASAFQATTSHSLLLSFGSTGKHYAQIKHGAPFAVFLAADSARPQLLEQEGLAVPGTRFTYALGKLVLWSPQTGYVDPQANVLKRAPFRYLAIANPRLAPYGLAAREVLEAHKLWDTLQDKLVRGENIAQTYQFVTTGNAQLGFVAFSHIKHPGKTMSGSYWVVPAHLHTPIRQEAVLLRDSPAARAFLAYLRSDEAAQIIRAYGYEIE